MPSYIGELIAFVAILAPMVAYLLGRVIEHRHWRPVVESASRLITEQRLAEIHLLNITRDQRHLLAVFTDAANEVAREGGPTSEARHRLSWAAHRAASELL